VIGLFFNECTIKYVLRWGGPFHSAVKSALLIGIELLVIAAGVFILRQEKKALSKLLVGAISLIITLFILEFFLSMDVFDNLSSEAPIWVPVKYKRMSAQFEKIHEDKAKYNEFGFNDQNHS
jgi:hypothetical protein